MINVILGGIMIFVSVMMIRHAFYIKMIQKHGKCPRGVNGQSWHQWHHQYNWNSGFRSKYTGDCISRDGSRCYNCGEWDWDQTDEEFQESISGVVK